MLSRNTSYDRERSDFERLQLGGALRLARPDAFVLEMRGWLGWAIDKIDGVLLAIFLIPTAVYIFDANQLYPLLERTKEAIEKTVPLMMVAIVMAGAAKVIGAESLIAKAATQREGRMIALFAVCGALLPFCSCGVVPVIASLLAAGVPLAPVMAFWMSAPLMGSQSVLHHRRRIGLAVCNSTSGGSSLSRPIRWVRDNES
jgi:uncharacterized membrane protein YraQ (UPF0718 family)